jgi:membrane protease YdiL (CAAX protease family)
MQALTADLPAGSVPDYLSLARSVAGDLVLRYGAILALAFVIGWWHRRRRITDYGVTLAARPVSTHLKWAIVAFAVGGLIPRVLIFSRKYVPALGTGPTHWQLQETWTWEFWLFMAVSSFLIVPIVEELFARGYAQTRLAEDYGAPTAIVIIAFFFTLAHRQYFRAEIISVGMLLGTMIASLIGGYVRHATGSLLPVVIGHAMGNVPMSTPAELGMIAGMLMVVIIARRPIVEHGRQLGAMLRSVEPVALIASISALLACFVIVIAARPLVPALGVVALAGALALHRSEKNTVLRGVSSA